MSDLTAKEQRHVRTALRFLRLGTGAWEPLADALGFQDNTIEKIVNGRRNVTPRLALRVARLVDIGVDELLAGKYLPGRTCPHCGHPPDDFVDEETTIDGMSQAGLKLVK